MFFFSRVKKNPEIINHLMHRWKQITYETGFAMQKVNHEASPSHFTLPHARLLKAAFPARPPPPTAGQGRGQQPISPASPCTKGFVTLSEPRKERAEAQASCPKSPSAMKALGQLQLYGEVNLAERFGHLATALIQFFAKTEDNMLLTEV